MCENLDYSSAGFRLETERLILRKNEEKDLLDLHRLISDKKNMYFVNDIITNNLEETRANLKNSIENPNVRFICMELKENNKFAGQIGYTIEKETSIGKIVHMGWFILPEFQNKGYVTEAAKKVLEYAFMHDNCVRVETGCYKDNIATQKVMAKAGFRKEAERIQAAWHDGQMKDRLGYVINRDEYMIDEYNKNDDIYHDFWIKELLPEYKFTGEYEFLQECECSAAYAVAKACKAKGFTGESEQFLREWLTGEEDNTVLIHKIDGKIVGISCTCIYSRNHEKGAVVWVRMIATMPEFQGRGIGRNLLMQTLQYGVEHGAKRAFLHVDLKNKNAVKLYESIGFVRD